MFRNGRRYKEYRGDLSSKVNNVRTGRLELPRITPYASETYAYTSSATSA